MRFSLAGANLLESVALRTGRVPIPAGLAMFGMPTSRMVGVAQRLGIFARLLEGPAGARELADLLGLREPGTRLVCEGLAGMGVLRARGERFALHPRARRWLDPSSPTYMGTFIEHTLTYWEWWGSLEEALRDGHSFAIHEHAAQDEEYWRVYITGQYELARLSAGEVARRISLPAGARSVLDLAGAHGWFAAELCRRHPGLSATVLDLPGSVRAGRRIIAAAGLQERVVHREGDMFTAELGGPHDAVLLFDILHHLDAEATAALLARVRASLRTGGTLAVLDMFRAPAGTQTMTAAMLGTFFHLTSGVDLPDPSALERGLREAGFASSRRRRILRLPDQVLLQATAVA